MIIKINSTYDYNRNDPIRIIAEIADKRVSTIFDSRQEIECKEIIQVERGGIIYDFTKMSNDKINQIIANIFDGIDIFDLAVEYYLSDLEEGNIEQTEWIDPRILT